MGRDGQSRLQKRGEGASAAEVGIKQRLRRMTKTMPGTAAVVVLLTAVGTVLVTAAAAVLVTAVVLVKQRCW
jgi:hypothetical protein